MDAKERISLKPHPAPVGLLLIQKNIYLARHVIWTCSETAPLLDKDGRTVAD